MSDLSSLFLYLFCFTGSAYLLSIGIKKSSKLLRFIALLIPILLIGFRHGVGTDFDNYVIFFEEYSVASIFNLLSLTDTSGIEIGFLALIIFSALFTSAPWLMFLLSSTATIAIAYLAIKRLSPASVPLAFLLYLLVLAPFLMNGVRQGIAVSIVFFAYSYIIQGNPIKYILTIIVASLFHTSALALLPLYLFRFITVKNRADEALTLTVSILVAIISVLLIPLGILLLSTIPVLSAYSRYVGFESGIALAPIVLMAILIVIVVALYHRVTDKFPAMKLMAALLFIEFASLLLGGISAAFSRMSFYLVIGGLVYMANIPLIFSNDTRRVSQFIVTFYGISYFTYFYFINGYSDIFPYITIWSGSL